MKAFVQRCGAKILGVLSGFDRIRFRGSLRLLSDVGGTSAWLHSKRVLLKDFLGFAEGMTKQLRKRTEAIAEQAGRPVVYLESFCNKEELVRKIRDEQGVADNGLIAVLSTLKSCRSYDISRNRATEHIDLRRRNRRALHYYFYFDDGKFGLTHVRLKHRAGRNTIKMYDKFGSVLRVETTLNDPTGLKVYRTKQNDPGGKKEWLPLRKSVADLSRRTALSQKSNDRYLEGLSAFDCDEPLKKFTDKVCQRVQVGKRWHRGLRPFDPVDVKLFEAVSRGEFAVSGFRNRDLRLILEGDSDDAADRRRASARVSRKLAMLRAHGLIKKISHTHRYEMTVEGQTTITALLSARNATPKQLAAA